MRKANVNDIKDIESIYNLARVYMKKCGVNQWINGYPSEENIKSDIKNNSLYVLDEKGIAGVAYLMFDEEASYDKIYDGNWSSDVKYATIHRFAVKDRGSGSAKTLLKGLEKIIGEKGYGYLRIDTHEDNLTMQRFLEKQGFKKCGIIYLTEEKMKNDKRLAYDKLL